ncbi:MAG TPA: energy transducer TonB [Chitinophagales bacterium]|nr:energy transducer TonB [Chitinophagales bacterium]
MKQTFSILLLLFLLAKSYAQDIIYLKNVDDTFATQKEKAIYFKVIDNKVNPIEVVTFYMNGVIVSKAHYSSLKPEIREGEYESYFYNGNTNIKGTFKDDKMEGSWIAYNKEKNFLETKTTYKDNLKSGRSYIFYETGKLKRMDIYVRDTLGLSTCYDSVGNVINCAMQVEPIENLVDTFGIFTKVDTMPKFPGGVPELMTFLFKNLNYPKVAREKNLEGKVITKFYIDIDGTVKNPIVVKDGVGGGCAEEAIRVIKKMPKWLPGIINGKKVKVYYTLPISFKLS